VLDEEQSSPPVTPTTTIPAMTELDAKENELIEHEARLNETIDVNLRSHIDRDPRAVWLLYLFQLILSVSFTLLSLLVAIYIFVDRDSYNTYGYHFGVMANLLALVGAVLSDSYLGKWLVLLSACGIFIGSMVLLSVFLIPTVVGSLSDGILFIPLAVASFGIGFIVPTILAFGGDQFLAIQEHGRARYFALMYFMSCAGGLIAVYVQPAVVFDYNNNEQESGIMYSAILTLAAALVPLLILLIGRRRFRTTPPMREFVVFKMAKAAVVAAHRFSSASPTERAAAGHWLNFAAKDHGSLFVQEVCDFGLAISHILLPVFFMSMLANHTDTFSWHMSMFFKTNDNITRYFPTSTYPALQGSILVSILLFTFVVFPLLERRGWKVSLHRRLGAGFLCALVAFALSLIVHAAAQDAYMDAFPRQPGQTDDDIRFPFGDRECSSCISQWAMLPQCIFLAFYYALAMPAAYHIVYIESGRRLRTFAMAILLVALFLSNRVDFYEKPLTLFASSAKTHGLYGGLGAVGFVVYLITMRFYTPRKERASINEAARRSKEAEYSKL
ncbi:hypothetical protein DFQ27_007101, partial [Actinomortierella ambigua]